MLAILLTNQVWLNISIEKHTTVQQGKIVLILDCYERYDCKHLTTLIDGLIFFKRMHVSYLKTAIMVI